ncbi:hypothetical protein ACFQGT_16175 [Natrialbaceae archaeon GCM10025810]|uniref:hypothetical protein n=1 Tax=Halovalidus salilacus TaxID=3075124 RepID=UPI00361E15EC
MVYITRGLADVLLGLASDADPDQISTGVSVTPAGDLEGADADALPPKTPVFTHFVLPEIGSSITFVFGVDLSTPARGAQGRFVSHPVGELSVSRRDDLAQVVFVAVPPWGTNEESFGAFERSGDRLPLEILDAEPPEEWLVE